MEDTLGSVAYQTPRETGPPDGSHHLHVDAFGYDKPTYDIFDAAAAKLEVHTGKAMPERFRKTREAALRTVSCVVQVACKRVISRVTVNVFFTDRMPRVQKGH